MQGQICLVINLNISSTISCASKCSPAYGFMEAFHFSAGHLEKIKYGQKQEKGDGHLCQ